MLDSLSIWLIWGVEQVIYVPLQIVLCMIFLYQILGWSSFVGFFVLVGTLPLPGYIAKLSQDVSREKMKMVCCFPSRLSKHSFATLRPMPECRPRPKVSSTSSFL